ncbi:MAG: hypothetical protein SV760_05495, partial [Halobacteria archaeon]|nr:hypothetical protein [Halobacteria archaeon]
DREEDEDEMVFLHEVVEEASSESYGVEVARMAGVPDSVVERAEELIHDGAFSDGSVTSDVGDGGAEAEKTNGHDSTVRITDFSGNGDENGGSDASNVFEESETGSSGSTETSFDTGVDTDTDTATDVLNEIRETDTANITPVEALNRLNSLKKKLADTETETDKEA